MRHEIIKSFVGIFLFTDCYGNKRAHAVMQSEFLITNKMHQIVFDLMSIVRFCTTTSDLQSKTKRSESMKIITTQIEKETKSDMNRIRMGMISRSYDLLIID